ncbi:MAG: hypothetical protein LBD68_09530, partial [Zoogloeaceae bacterium]|nr:hypothetical protein [Zoogloeaceae bacterium]
MRIAVFGAGAIGVYLAARLADSGFSVCLIARAGTARKIAQSALHVEETDMPTLRVFPQDGGLAVTTATGARKAGAFDALLIAVKSQQILPALPEIRALIAPHTLIVCLQNGIPWWYFQGQDGRPLKCLDPDNELSAALPARQLLGGVIHKSVELCRP